MDKLPNELGCVIIKKQVKKRNSLEKPKPKPSVNSADTKFI